MDAQSPLAFAIRKINLEYLKPARIDDALTVVTTYDMIKGARMTLSQSVFRGEDLLLTASGEAVCIDLAGRPKRLPKDMIGKLAPYLEQ